MTFEIRKCGIIAFLLTGAAAVSSGQTGTINVRDLDEQARNAYQRTCALRAIGTDETCRFPPLPVGKRLAIRWFSATCTGASSRVRGFRLAFPMGDGDQGSSNLRGPLQPVGNSSDTRFIEAPLYAHSDEGPIAQMFLTEPVGFQPVDCFLQIRGYVIQK